MSVSFPIVHGTTIQFMDFTAQAIALDPKYAKAYFRCVIVAWIIVRFGLTRVVIADERHAICRL